jgi:hypothetical protein
MIHDNIEIMSVIGLENLPIRAGFLMIRKGMMKEGIQNFVAQRVVLLKSPPANFDVTIAGGAVGGVTAERTPK